MASISRAFIQTKVHARKRGIAFKFTKEQWIAWWEANLGPDWMDKRGCKRHQYVMARNGDKGCYEPSNVRCILSVDNHKERKQNGNHSHGINHPRCRLTEADILAIRATKCPPKGGPTVFPIKSLAEKYHVSRRLIHDIRAGRRWKHL